MRVLVPAIIAAASLAIAVPAAAQNQALTANQAAPAPKASKATKSRQAAKPGELICKRLTQGKVCMTAEKWKQYEDLM